MRSAVNSGNRIITDGLIFYLDVANSKSYISGSTTTNDLISNIDGTLVNGVGYDTDNLGSFVFDGIDDYVNFLGSNPITGNSPFSMCGWFDTKNHTDYGIGFYIGNSSLLQSAYIGYVLNAQYGTNTSIGGGLYGSNIGSGILVNTGWHNIVLTSDGSIFKLYVDGSIIETESPIILEQNLSPLSIRLGRANAGANVYHYNGDISNVFIYNKELSPSEVLQNYNVLKYRFT
jgi:hypothetical protein